MILAIDFDGTLHDNEHPIAARKMGPPLPGAIEAMQRLASAGHKLIIFSVWAHVTGRHAIDQWLRFYKIPFDDITNVKPQADIYLDDKAIRFVDWPTFEKELIPDDPNRRPDSPFLPPRGGQAPSGADHIRPLPEQRQSGGVGSGRLSNGQDLSDLRRTISRNVRQLAGQSRGG